MLFDELRDITRDHWWAPMFLPMFWFLTIASYIPHWSFLPLVMLIGLPVMFLLMAIGTVLQLFVFAGAILVSPFVAVHYLLTRKE